MKHIYVVHNPECKEDDGCPICEWGAAECSECRLVEGELTPECCGKEVPRKFKDAIYTGLLTFENGGWWRVSAGEMKPLDKLEDYII